MNEQLDLVDSLDVVQETRQTSHGTERLTAAQPEVAVKREHRSSADIYTRDLSANRSAFERRRFLWPY